MTPRSTAWQRLTAAARQAPDLRDTAAPYGFATRVAALAFSGERSAASLVQQLSLRALLVAGVFCLACVALNLGPVLGLIEEDPLTASTENVSLPQYDDLS